MKTFFLSTLFLFGFSFAFSQSTVSTFHCISLYWSPVDGDDTKVVLVEFKEASSNIWKSGLDMKYQPIAGCGNNPITNERYDKADYRGSIVNLTPATTYDIKLTLDGTSTISNIQATTWDEVFPIDQTIVVGDMTTQYSVPSSGTENGYLLIDGTNATIDIQDGSNQCIQLVDKSYVIIRGFTLENAGSNGIRLYNCHHIVIEDCDISGWGQEGASGNGFGQNYQSGIYAGTNSAAHMVIQRNKIHHPRWDTNSWAELNDPNDDPNNNSNYHPEGPQGISLGNCYIGNNVIRYNEIWSDSSHYFNDILGMWSNASYSGFPGSDSDIYGNHLANSWDDGIESEGSNTNVRIFANYVENNLIPIANAATSIGPLYIWKNISGRSYSLPGSVYGEYGSFLKLGFASNISWMTGQTYVFNNTILQPNGEGAGGLGTRNSNNRYIKHLVSRNNIFHVKDETTNAISIHNTNEDIDYDYDLLNKPFPAGHESNGISNDTPLYASPAPTFDDSTKIGDFRLSSNSPGYDEGVIINNFMDIYNGTAPDMGAHEAGTDPMVFGVNSDYSIPLIPLPIKLIEFTGVKTGNSHKLSWAGQSTNMSYFQVEYSELLGNWQPIQSHIPAVNNTQIEKYNLLHSTDAINNYYRLKMVDINNKYQYSNIVYLEGRQSEIVITPNPANDFIKLSNVIQGSKIHIYNSNGALIKTETYNNNQPLNISSLVKGVYLIKITDKNDIIFTQKLIKL